MSNYPSVAAEAGDKYLEMLAEGQDRFVEYVRSAREFMPQVPPQFAAQFAAQAPATPFAFSAPSPRDFADAQFQFATKLLKQQESFMRKLYKLAAPAAPAKAKKASASGSASRSNSSKSRSTARKTTRRARA